MGCLKLEILDQQYKRTEPKVSYHQNEPTFNFCAGKERRLLVYAYCGNNPVSRVDPDGRDWYEVTDAKTNEKTV